MNKDTNKQRLSLVLLVSIFVFLIVSVAVILAAVIVYILFRFGVINSLDDELDLSRVFVIAAVVSAIIGFLITFFSSKFSLKPVNQLVNQLDRLANGDFKARIHFGNPIAIHPTFIEIENSFNTAAEHLERTEMLRSDFINNFSHEFKTPIVSIAGFAKMLRLNNLSEKEKQDYLKIIEEESLRLSYMANNVLNLTKVENQAILTGACEYNLSEQIRLDILMLGDMWTAKNLNLEVDFDEYTIRANKELLEQAWLNLLNNAVKFSSDNGTLSVGITEDENSISVTIGNQGEAIPEKSLDRIFDKFYQADESHSSAGNGIGLAIVKKVVDLHSGRVFAKCENGTTTFTVTLPKNL